MKHLILLLLLQALCYNAAASEVIKETHLYSVKGTDSLYLDRYYVNVDSLSQELKPAIIFMFGGAFYTGTRDNKYFTPCFDYYAKLGYEVFSIDYRLGLKNVKPTSAKSFSEFVLLIQNAIDFAVVDLYDATNYIIDQSEWYVNPEIIVPFGSSAGAISVLQAEYYLANKNPLAEKLPVEFRYAGIISMSGAIFSTNGKLKWENKLAPILMFQGSADRNVPYNKKGVFQYVFYGSESIAKSLRKIKTPYYFYTFVGAGHEIAVLPMNENREDIDEFLVKLVHEKLPFEITKSLVSTTRPKVKHRFTLREYLKANFKPTPAEMSELRDDVETMKY